MTVPIVSSLIEQYDSLREQFVVIQQAFAPLNLTRWQLARLLAAQVWRDTSPFARAALLVLVGGLVLLLLDSYIVQPYFYSLRRLGVPQLTPSNGRHAFDYKPMLDEAAEKYPDRPWFFSYSGFELVVFPSAYVDEVRRLPARTASLIDFLTTVQFGGWHLIGSDSSSSTLHKTASTDLARSVGPLSLSRQETALRAWKESAGPLGPGEWTTLPLLWTLLDVVVKTGAVGLVGEPLARDPRWVRAVQRLPIAVGVGVYTSCYFPRLLRPLVATLSYFPAYLLHKWLGHLLQPTVDQAVRDRQARHGANGANAKHDAGKVEPEKKLTLVNLLLEKYKPGELRVEQLSRDVITASFESTPTTAVSLYWMITELLLRPELVDELREELNSVLKGGKLPQTQLAELPKMDSFMRESARVNTFHYLGLSRILREPVKFSIGPTLPAGTIVCVDQEHIHNSAALYPEPETFDPLRFYRRRQEPGQETRHQYTNNGPDLLTWGDGPQVCPGRVFAGNTIKILLANLLLNYDIQMPAGQYKPGRLSFPNGSVQPDMNTKIMIRERRK